MTTRILKAGPARLGLLFLCIWAATDHAPAAEPRPQSVRFVYLVSADRTVREDFRRGVETAARDVQSWYARQLGGPTFLLNDPVVEVAKSDKEADWFSNHRNGFNKDDWGFNNGLAEARRLVGARQGDPRFVWVIYSDGPGNKGRGGDGVTVLPEDDLLGLVGRHPEQKDVKRWIAGLGHELGHAFGLAHPTDLVKDADAIMWLGIYGKYPDRTYLTEDDRRVLLLSPFFFRPDGQPVLALGDAVEKYVYDGGSFAKHVIEGKPVWVESKEDGRAQFRFTETGRDGRWIRLSDPGRGMSLRLPVAGGTCSWSTDGGRTWNALYRVRKAT
ncbi:MAG: hypothetical protein U0790_09790 [Isosphaeraceae bacterium]